MNLGYLNFCVIYNHNEVRDGQEKNIATMPIPIFINHLLSNPSSEENHLLEKYREYYVK